MDFTLSLTHFCEAHGPKSVLCTQVLPLECALCLPPSPFRATTVGESLATQVQDSVRSIHSSRASNLHKTGTCNTLTGDFSGASTSVDSTPPSPTIEKHPLFVGSPDKVDPAKRYRYGRAQGDTCESCSFSVPRKVTDQLPDGAPGSIKSDGKGKNGSPVFRSRELVCLGGCEHGLDDTAHAKPLSLESNASTSPHLLYGDFKCHDHLLTYLTSRSPDDPEKFSLLRASVIRTLSCELLPRGMSDGPLCFGDSAVGYTIAYVFRLADPKARGRRRAYAFVALAGRDASRAFRACPLVWEAFGCLVQSIEATAQRYQEEQKHREEQERDSSKARNYTPVSSFLTQRTADPDGFPRRVGQVSPRSLAEIVGDENIFAVLHQYFVQVLRCLGDTFGGLPLSDTPAVYQSLLDEEGLGGQKPPAKVRTEMVGDTQKLRGEESTSKPDRKNETERAMANMSISNQPVKQSTQCRPLPVAELSRRQIVA